MRLKLAIEKNMDDVMLLVMRGWVSSIPKYQSKNPILEDHDDDDQNE